MKILGIGSNYVTDLKDIPEKKKGKKFIFSKPESSLAVNCDVEYPSKITNELIYEVELVVKVGKEGKNITKENANSYISEIAIGIDYTAKDILTKARETKHPWEFAKGFDGAAPISTFKSIENYDLGNIDFDLKINGEEKQKSNTAYMINDFADIISFISEYMTLQPGDLIFTGTPALGKGEIFKGDQLQCSINGELLLDFKMI
ncbi:fumarylacetoacetate hydrolase family protein [Polaribacter dokdonensis]|uniref:2-keto-4-pentenoate hydratase/2-oxohepta-3-ene-1,7-dioic acid hydratase (Catechol pathway) n=1 Tax=Polaribacter dokdonensis DSW-5 TaxID=1300348 RepID=A0A0N0CFX6_9FLAO|nr:fumarylacetoacetate hydrolase family protein [Polaribacter dokdonensis]KOY52530.1 Fumarylacetoacetate (FAA) hydrolase family protein [Polaribacter dokdonensis DSW-5]SEE47318.1 2-keto-4-pentenoate hydratase/2-oxohepta-3-ene-1,7-dioic acid hydratase (catechol pathway) [Polaribacter dokdonensis DSW-5]